MKILNKRAGYDYDLHERFEAGIQLLGAEVKAVRLGHADLSGSHVRITNGQAYLVNASIFPYQYSRPERYDEKRSRKLLLHKKEILALKAKMDGQKLTVVPISLYTTSSFIKVQLALAKGKKQYQKKETIRQRDLDRQMEEEFF
ncbi:MAG TPA: SsrA-binding protein SmpB [Patescibacteria group bacterium]|nr:SsrA-binding protein SmpB [Patescibacteria group bacterium]